MKNSNPQLYSDICTDFNELFRLKILKKPPQKPWMRQRELKIIQEVLTVLQPASCLEWGAGFSTIYFPGFVSMNTPWITIENNEIWFEKIKALNSRLNVRINHIPITPEDDKSYVSFPRPFGPFDFIFVDGRLRLECLKEASDLLSERGIVILHDANRVKYADGLKYFRYGHLFQDQRRNLPVEKIGGGIFVGSRGRPLTDVLDIHAHQQMWDNYNNLGRIFKSL